MRKNIESKITIDKKHNDYIKLFKQNNTKSIPNLIKEKEKLTKKLETLKDKDIEDKLDIKDKIKIINYKIKMFIREEKNFFLNNSSYILNYFENKKHINDNNNNNK